VWTQNWLDQHLNWFDQHHLNWFWSTSSELVLINIIWTGFDPNIRTSYPCVHKLLCHLYLMRFMIWWSGEEYFSFVMFRLSGELKTFLG
jgi:hypothetical protein